MPSRPTKSHDIEVSAQWPRSDFAERMETSSQILPPASTKSVAMPLLLTYFSRLDLSYPNVQDSQNRD